MTRWKTFAAAAGIALLASCTTADNAAPELAEAPPPPAPPPPPPPPPAPPPPQQASSDDAIVVSGHRVQVQESVATPLAVAVIDGAPRARTGAVRSSASGEATTGAGVVIDSIEAEDIGKSTAQNIAEALQRVTGVSVSASGGEGTTVTMRGVSADAGNVSLNGVPLGKDVQLAGDRYAFIPGVIVPPPANRDQYDGEDVAPAKWVMSEPVSTFAVDVDTGAYANARRFLTSGQLPPKDAVRTEELINYFRYDYPMPDNRAVPFSVTTDFAVSPWNANTRLMRIGLRGYDLPKTSRPAANLVFLLDVSGSMNARDKLPLVKTAMKQLANQLGEEDRVSIVVYAGAAGVVLQPTNSPGAIRTAIDNLRAGGSTAGGAGIELAYRIAEENRIKGGVNRVILATDGDFNVGISDKDQLVEMIERKRKGGVTLSVLGFGRGNLNDAMMEQLANNGNGNYSYIDSAIEANKVLGDEMGATLFTIAKDVKIQVEFNPAHVSQYRLIGYENRALREEDFDNDAVDAGDIGAGHQVTALYEIVPAGTNGWMPARRYQREPAFSREGAGEVAFVKLRYKLPDEDSSRLIERPVSTQMLASADLPTGDMAFITAVAAYGQKLRGDTLMGGFGFGDAISLAGKQDGYWREEFLKLASIADGLDDSARQDDGRGG